MHVALIGCLWEELLCIPIDIIKLLAKRSLAYMQAFGQILQDLFDLFNQIVTLHSQLIAFLKSLLAGDFIQCSLETLLLVQI